jgi:GNAT superfamily N-acetyltransferase
MATGLPDPTALWLADGRSVAIRPIRPEDAVRLMALFDRLSPETVRRRFLALKAHLDPREATRFAGVDHVADEALVALPRPPGAGEERIVAVARYARTAPDGAELALVVEDTYQGQGLGRALLDRLLRLARARGLHTLHADVLPDNARVLHLLQASGYPVTVSWAEGTWRVVLRLDASLSGDANTAPQTAGEVGVGRAYWLPGAPPDGLS